jgi:hypothetical protein
MWAKISVRSYRRGVLDAEEFLKASEHGRDFVLGLLRHDVVYGLGGRGRHELTGISTITQINGTWRSKARRSSTPGGNAGVVTKVT